MTDKEVAAAMTRIHAMESPEMREALAYGRAQNAKRYACKDGLVLFGKGTDLPITK